MSSPPTSAVKLGNIIDKHLIVGVIRRWLYIITVGFYLFGILLPLSVITYLTFYKTLIPEPIISIPLQFHNQVSQVDLNPYKSQFMNLDYLVTLNIEILCNRNRNDDVFPIMADIEVGAIQQSKQFILNCDARYIYHANNLFIPYNLRFWTFPSLSNIDKNVNIRSELVHVEGKQLLQQLHTVNDTITLTIGRDIIIDHDNTFLEFHVQYQGFRYYITKYYYRSMVVGVLIFWAFCLITSLLTALVIIYGENSGRVEPIKRE